MKKTILTAVLMGALLSGSLSAAFGKTIFSSENSNRITLVTFQNVAKGDRLRILDKDGKILYTERIKTGGTYSKRFDLSAFPEDAYQFEVDKAGAIVILPFEVEGESIALKNRTDIVKPNLVAHKDQVILSRDVEGDQSLTIDIFHEGRKVYSEEVSKTGRLARQYDFSTSVMGEYLFKITYEGRTFTEYVDVR